MKAMVSTAIADGWPFRTVSFERNRVETIAAQIRDDHAIPDRRQQQSDIDEAVNVVGPAVEKNDSGPVCGTGLSVSDIQDTGIDLLERGKPSIRSRLDWRQLCHSCFARLRMSQTE